MLPMDKTLKKVINIYTHGSQHWVGDGFHVKNFFPSNDIDRQTSPFLLLDYAGPTEFAPTHNPHGVGEHPHRGFETVTIVYQGSVTHRDSAGNHGTIHPGDVQWMTAASGVVHEEMHEKAFAEKGGTMEMVQLWVNLPKAKKYSPPSYQTLTSKNIPIVNLPEHAGIVRVIAGNYENMRGPAKVFTPINLYDVFLSASHEVTFSLPKGYNSGIFLLHGAIEINHEHVVEEARFILFEPEGEKFIIKAKKDAKFLVLNGEPILETIVRYGPFVMNTTEELHQASEDYRSGKMGHLGG